jgi:hypothetical protein
VRPILLVLYIAIHSKDERRQRLECSASSIATFSNSEVSTHVKTEREDLVLRCSHEVYNNFSIWNATVYQFSLTFHSSSESAKDPFEEAQTRFLDSLSAEERLSFTPCTTDKELLAALNDQAKGSESFKSWGNSILPQIRTFSERLQPYLEIVSIFVQSNPQYNAIVWGSLRLIFQV